MFFLHSNKNNTNQIIIISKVKVILLFLILVSLNLKSIMSTTKSTTENNGTTTTTTKTTTTNIPPEIKSPSSTPPNNVNRQKIVFYLHDSRQQSNQYQKEKSIEQTIEQKLYRIFEQYKNDMKLLLDTISNEYSIVMELEQQLMLHTHTIDISSSSSQNENVEDNNSNNRSTLLSKAFEIKIKRTVEASDSNELFLKELLLSQPSFPFVYGLPSLYYDDEVEEKYCCDDVVVAMNTSSNINDNNNINNKKKQQCNNRRWIIYKNTKDINKHQQQALMKNDDNNNNNNEDDSPSSHDYESAMQIIAHSVRDWSNSGKIIRKSLYDWCIHQLQIHVMEEIQQQQKHTSTTTPTMNILVPGAALGRLAYDIYYKTNAQHNNNCNVIVEANDSSISMAAAAYHILNNFVVGEEESNHDNKERIIYPFIYDYFSNEVDTNRRFESNVITFSSTQEEENEDEKHQSTYNNNNRLFYTIGDFTKVYSSKIYQSKFDSIVTCFFLDTSINVYEYILIIRNILNSNGNSIWINVGPLQWHKHSIIHVSVDELRNLLISFGFEILVWFIDTDGIHYRNHDDESSIPRLTKVEMYKPLRFVVRLKKKSNEANVMPIQKFSMILNQMRRDVHDSSNTIFGG